MIASILLCAFVMRVVCSLEEECNILMKLDSLETRVQEQEINLRDYQISLREQAVSLAEKDTRIGDLEQSMTEKDTHIDDLKQSIAELESSSTEKDTRIDEFEAGIIELEKSMTEKDTRIGDLEQSMTEKTTLIGELETSLSQQATDINELRTTLNTTLNINTTVLANLEQRLRPVQAIGFTAKWPKETQPASNQMTFLTVLTNEGGAFNASTGVFTCPMAGVYYFNAALLKHNNHDGPASCYITKNGGVLVWAVTLPEPSPRTGSYAAVNGAYTRLAVNDNVTLGGCRTPIENVFHHFSTFSGFLVTPDD